MRIGLSLKLSEPKYNVLAQNIQALFADGSQGWWYDDNDTTTLFQDSAGTTPVTAVEQFVGLQLDKSKGLVLGPELVDAFTLGTGWSYTNGVLTCDGSATLQSANETTNAVTGKFYLVTFRVTYTSGLLQVRSGNVFLATLAASGTFTYRIAATAGASVISFTATNPAFVGSIDNISVRELPGNHRYAPASGNRPIWSKRVNLLTKTEQFDDAAWTKGANITVTANAVAAPDGSTTADLVVSSTNADSSLNQVFQQATVGSSATYTASLWARAAGANQDIVIRQTANGVLVANTTVSVTNAWQRITVTFTAATNPGFAIRPNGVSNLNVYIWGADLRPANQATGLLPLYQRVDTSTDYDTNGFPGYLKADGVDDFLQTNSIDFGAGPTNPPIIGPELVVNGTFDTNTTGWTALSGGVLSVVGGQLKVENSTTFGRASQAITVTANRWYEIRAQAVAGTANATIRFGNSGAGSSQYVNATNTTGTFVWRVFATATTIDATLYVESASVGATVFFDNVSVREIDAAYAPDKITLCAGVRKLSDAAQAVVTELSATIASNNGTFLLAAPDGATNTYGWDSKGTTQVDAVASTFTAPITNVVTGIGNISGDSAIIRVNGVVADTETGDQGTGNYGNYPVYFFHRNTSPATLRFNGYEYGNIAVGKLLTADQLTALETYMNGLTKAY
jgi:hypothetical protein